MASKIKLSNANGKIVTIENNDSNMSDVTLNGASITKKVDTLADMRAMAELPETVWCSGYHSKNDGAFGSHFYRLKGLKTTETDNSGTIIIVSVGGSDYVYELQYSGAVNVKWFGAVGNSLDSLDSLQLAVDYAALMSKELIFSGGEYGITPRANGTSLNIRDGSVWRFTNGSSLLLLSDTGPIGGFIGAGYVDAPNDNTPLRADNVRIYDIKINCNNIPGENAFGLNGTNLRLYNPMIINVARSNQRLGGRCFQFEGADVDDIKIYNPYLNNCDIGINSQGSQLDTTKSSRFITYYNVVMKNVSIPFNIDNTYDGVINNTQNANQMSTLVVGANLYDCGKLQWTGSLPLDGGIVTGDRGFGLRIDSMRITNSVAYGAIGALVRGTMFGLELNNISFEGTEVKSMFDHTPLSSTSFPGAAQGSFNSTTYANNVSMIKSKIGYIVKTKPGGGALGSCIFKDIRIDTSIALLTDVCDVNAVSYSNATLELFDIRQGTSPDLVKSTRLINLSQFAYGLSNLLSKQKNILNKSWAVTDGSGAALVLTGSDFLFVHQDTLIDVWLTITFPVTADTRGNYITGLPVTPREGFNAKFPINSTLYNIKAVGNPSKAFQLFKEDGTLVKNSELSGKTFNIHARYFV